MFRVTDKIVSIMVSHCSSTCELRPQHYVSTYEPCLLTVRLSTMFVFVCQEPVVRRLKWMEQGRVT